VDILKNDFQQYESESEKKKRENVIAKLSSLVEEWMYIVGRKEGKDDEVIKNSMAKIFIYGSCRLGVQTSDTDIDLLCVAPRHIDRNEHLFGELAQLLRNQHGVTELNEVREAYVPVIKM
jgi:poly(A) polymerase